MKESWDELIAPLHDPMYVQGYTAALQDVLKTFREIQGDLKRNKRKQSYKTYSAIVECMLQSRVLLRESHTAFIRCNDRTVNGFEAWDNRYNHMKTEKAALLIAALCGDETAWRKLKHEGSD